MLHHAKQLYTMLLLILALPLAAQDYTLVWEDDFNAPTLDTAYWNVDDNARGGGNAEMQYYTPRNVTIERHPVSGESCLVLNAKREDYRNRPATSGRVNTQAMACGLRSGCWATTLPPTLAMTIPSIRKRSS